MGESLGIEAEFLEAGYLRTQANHVPPHPIPAGFVAECPVYPGRGGERTAVSDDAR
jgi:hypothetical protein